MNEPELRQLLVEEIGNIAPDADASSVDIGADLRDALDLDSMDFLNLVIALHQRLGVDIPETDYPKLRTLGGMLGYFGSKLDR
jgi:acyl carrier protein